MKKIRISGEKNKDKCIIVDDDNYSELIKYKWYLKKQGYARRNNWVNKRNKEVKIHHQILGKPKKGFLIDHINGDKLDNRKVNLRFATYSQNGANCVKSKRNTSGFKGVWARKNEDGKIIEWRTSIMKNRTVVFRESFNSKYDAYDKYKKMHKIFFGEYSKKL